MKKELSPTLKLKIVTSIILVLVSLSVGKSTTEFRIHDIYIVMNAVTKFIIISIIAVFVFSLVATVLTKFQNKQYLKLLLFTLFLLFSSGIYIFSLFMKVH